MHVPHTQARMGGHHCCSSVAAQALSNSFQLSLRDSLGIFPPVQCSHFALIAVQLISEASFRRPQIIVSTLSLR